MSEGADWLTGRKCRQCGKEFTVLHPSMWRYKIGEHNTKKTWFCSWGCIQEYRRRKEDRMRKGGHGLLEMARKCVEELDTGRDPLEFLRKQGYKDPLKAYQNVKQKARDADPELAARFPKRITKPAAKEKKEAEETEPATEIRTNDMDGYEATAIKKDGIGEFYYDKRSGTIDWRNEFGEEVSLLPADWARMAEEIPRMMKIMSVEV